jgi:ketosteroid isomerase-like protein
MITIDIDAEKKAIKELVKNAFEVEKHKDVDEIMALDYFTEDTVAHGPNMPQIKGLEALRNFYTEFFKILETIDGGSTEIIMSESGDMACDYGWNRTVYKGPDGSFEDEGKYLQVMKKINGKWKCVAISFSSDKPVN